MIDLWTSQAARLSVGQAVLLLVLTISLVGMVLLYKSMEDQGNV